MRRPKPAPRCLQLMRLFSVSAPSPPPGKMDRYPSNIHLIKDKLIEFKFEEDLTLATLDEKTGQELLETLNSVFAHLSKDHEVKP